MTPPAAAQLAKTSEQVILDLLGNVCDEVKEGRKENQATYKAVETIRANVVVSTVKLFGSADPGKENETGRLPKLEQSAKDADTRMNQIDRRLAWYAGALALATFLVPIAVTLAVVWVNKR